MGSPVKNPNTLPYFPPATDAQWYTKRGVQDQNRVVRRENTQMKYYSPPPALGIELANSAMLVATNP
jgi:hypothetical protein